MKPVSDKRRARLAAEGRLNPWSTFARAAKSAVAKVKRPRDTGPSREVRALVRRRSGGQCEWPGCINPATDIHHRMNRQGPRGEEALARLNAASNLLHACRFHHDAVTSQSGERLERAKTWGWVLRQWQHPELVAVHCTYGWVYLDDAGGWREAKDVNG